MEDYAVDFGHNLVILHVQIDIFESMYCKQSNIRLLCLEIYSICKTHVNLHRDFYDQTYEKNFTILLTEREVHQPELHHMVDK